MEWQENKKKYIAKYKKENIKRVPLDMQLADYEQLKSHVEKTGGTINGFIKAAIREAIQRSVYEQAEEGKMQDGQERSLAEIEETLHRNGWTQSVVASEDKMAEYVKRFENAVVGIEVALEPCSLGCYGYYGVCSIQVIKYENHMPYIRDDMIEMQDHIIKAECELLDIGVPFRPSYGFGKDLEHNLERNISLRKKYRLSEIEECT